jgi:hypothetical protein
MKLIKAFKKIINFNDRFPRCFKHSLILEELFFQSISMRFVRNKNSSLTLTFVVWQRKNCELPVLFTLHNFNELKAQSKFNLHAKKFDADIDETILNLLVKNI